MKLFIIREEQLSVRVCVCTFVECLGVNEQTMLTETSCRCVCVYVQ